MSIAERPRRGRFAQLRALGSYLDADGRTVEFKAQNTGRRTWYVRELVDGRELSPSHGPFERRLDAKIAAEALIRARDPQSVAADATKRARRARGGA